MACGPFNFIYHDESGKPGEDVFVVGILKVTDPDALRKVILQARVDSYFENEIHFQKISDMRLRGYLEVIKQVSAASHLFKFCSLVVESKYLSLKYFSNQEHLAYNFFTKLLLKHRTHDVANALLCTDQKTRRVEDNFERYIQWEVINSEEGQSAISSVIVGDSKLEPLLQLTDLLTGCVGFEARGGTNPKKHQVLSAAKMARIMTDVWKWRPKTKMSRRAYQVRRPNPSGFSALRLTNNRPQLRLLLNNKHKLSAHKRPTTDCGRFDTGTKFANLCLTVLAIMIDCRSD
jgi:hypothetical protein